MTTDQWGKGRYLKKEVEKALGKETELFSKTHVYKGKAGMGNGKWVVKKGARKEELKEYLRLKKDNMRFY